MKLFEGTASGHWFTFVFVMCLVFIGPCVGVAGALLRPNPPLAGSISVMAVSLLLIQLIWLVRRGLHRGSERAWAMIVTIAIITVVAMGMFDVLTATIG